MNISILSRIIFNLFLLFILSACSESSSEPGSVSETQPTVSLTSNKKAIRYNESITITWNISGVVSCDASGFDIKNRGKSGTMIIGPITVDTTFTLTCNTNEGVIVETINVSVTDQPTTAPELMISAMPTSLAYGETAIINWSTVNANKCIASGDWLNSKANSGSYTTTTSGSYTILSLTENRTFTLECSNLVGSVTDSVTVSISSSPNIALTAEPANIVSGGSTTLNWSSTNTSECITSGDWNGAKPTSGSQVINSITKDSTFQLSCSGTEGVVNKVVHVLVNPLPEVTIIATPEPVMSGDSTVINWSSANASSCIASGDWSGSKAIQGSEVISNVTSDRTFNLSCTGEGGSVSSFVNVGISLPIPTINISASPANITSGESTTISWASTGATDCTASGDWVGSKGLSGSEIIPSISVNKSFTLTCNNAVEVSNDTVSVTVSEIQSGTALLSWTPPTDNTDGTVLTDLTGYKIYYGTEPGLYLETVDVPSAGISTYLIENLSKTTWYFSITALNSTGNQSAKSVELSKTIF